MLNKERDNKPNLSTSIQSFDDKNKCLLILCSVDEEFERYKLREAVVYPNGEVDFESPVILKFTCKINARLFPFDWQVCNMQFSSWNYHGEELDILPSNNSYSPYKYFDYNGVWELKNIKVRLHNISYDYGPTSNRELKPVPQLIYKLYLKRRPLYHVLNILVPCFLLSILNLVVNLLPPEAGEKIGLGIANLLALVLFQELVANTLPPSSDNSPIIGE